MIFDIMNTLGDYAACSEPDEFLSFWNGWIASGVEIPTKAIPMMMAMAGELCSMDRDLLHDIQNAIRSML